MLICFSTSLFHELNLFLNCLLISLFNVNGYFVYMYVCIPHTCLASTEAKEEAAFEMEFQRVGTGCVHAENQT